MNDSGKRKNEEIPSNDFHESPAGFILVVRRKFKFFISVLLWLVLLPFVQPDTLTSTSHIVQLDALKHILGQVNLVEIDVLLSILNHTLDLMKKLR